MKFLFFIPARKGSKGIPNKNLKNLNGKPLIYYTLSFVNKINEVDKEIFVSTDSKKILNYSKKNGHKYNYLRPKKFSQDKSPIQDAIIHALKWLKYNEKKIFDAVVILQPTSPIRIISEINSALKFFKKKKINSLISVIKMREHPNECVELLANNKWKFLSKNPFLYSGRQQYNNNFYFIDGSFYILRRDFLEKKKLIFCKNSTKFFESRNKRSIDIDHPEDMDLASYYLKKKIKIV